MTTMQLHAAQRRCLAFLLLGCIVLCARTAAAGRPAQVQDSIAMTRIQYAAGAGDEVAAISPDGAQAAFVTWRGDLARNTNVYQLRLVDLRAPLGVRVPRVLLSRDYIGDRLDQTASPIRQLRFVRGGAAIAYLGLDGNGIAQAYLFDIASGAERQLTHHADPLRAFTLDAGGELIAFSAAHIPDSAGTRRLEEDGVFLWDRDVFPNQSSFSTIMPALMRLGGWNAVRQYFVIRDGAPHLVFDSRQSLPAATDNRDPEAAGSPSQSLADDSVLGFGAIPASPDGKRVLLYPYQLTAQPLHPERYAYYNGEGMNAYARRTAPLVGMVDVASGKIEPLLDAPSPQFKRYESGRPMWSRNGTSVIVYTLSPERPADPPTWVEVDVGTRRRVPLGLDPETRPIGWAADGRTLVLDRKGKQFGTLSRTADGGWGRPVYGPLTVGFNDSWNVVSDGRLLLGVRDTLKTPPELSAYDPATGSVTALTALNPGLSALRFGETTAYRWRSAPGAPADGFLVKPLEYLPGKRYPLVILLDDGTLGREGEPYLFDGIWQLSSHATQMLAAQGFMVLYTREPPMRDVVETAGEGPRILADIETAVARLDRDGLIDPARIGIAGWSRAGYYVSYLMIHSSIRFAAAINIDGGAVEYTERMRPFTDAELVRITTPVLFHSHGLPSLVHHGAIADRLLAMRKPAEILYFPAASHTTNRPRHRLRSLGTSIDWWRFWLMDQDAADPAKAAQYAHWHALRDMQQAAKRGGR
ncbi:hypothetical protein MWN52_02025 [Pseudoxanthomonas winnipegensis]|uniref:hypothetical protein n=1 Tax=Pseudoxanthomonas winnipegensis TaxID=2480810 RepID=UPI0025778E66|nr:hypothetical protein [Pseudoxanthomonas winnipegensis]WJI16111.1 hypothetical protein MWN52_02025 [Pseudoxanthomonas winnipegensis]